MTLLCTIEDAAQEIGVPVASLKTAAREHGYLVQMGRATRLERDRLKELARKCRVQPKEQGSTNSSTGLTGTSGTPVAPTAQRAAQAVKKLKNPSARTSPQKGAQVLPMSRKT